MTLVCPPVCVQDQLLGLHVQCHPHHLLRFPSECCNLKSICLTPFKLQLTKCLEHGAVIRPETTQRPSDRKTVYVCISGGEKSAVMAAKVKKDINIQQVIYRFFSLFYSICKWCSIKTMRLHFKNLPATSFLESAYPFLGYSHYNKSGEESV